MYNFCLVHSTNSHLPVFTNSYMFRS